MAQGKSIGKILEDSLRLQRNSEVKGNVFEPGRIFRDSRGQHYQVQENGSYKKVEVKYTKQPGE